MVTALEALNVLQVTQTETRAILIYNGKCREIGLESFYYETGFLRQY